jgi:hypothetical protein
MLGLHNVQKMSEQRISTIFFRRTLLHKCQLRTLLSICYKALLGLVTQQPITIRGWASLLLKHSAAVWQKCESACPTQSEQCSNITLLTLAKYAEQLVPLATSALHHVNRADMAEHTWHTWLYSTASFWFASPANCTKRRRGYSSVEYPFHSLQAIPYAYFSVSGQFFTTFQISYKPYESLYSVSNINHTNSGQCFNYKWSENLNNVSNINHANSGQCFNHKCSENLDNVSNITHTNSGQCFIYKWSENLDNVSNINYMNSGQCFNYKCSENLDNVSNINHMNSGQCFNYKRSENLDNVLNINHMNSGQCFK